MSVTKYKDGLVSVAVDFDQAALLKLAVNAATGGMLDVMETAAEQVATDARAAWYSRDNVTRRTGKSGDIQVVTTISEHEVRVSIGSTDLKKAIYVHRSRATATEAVEIDEDEYRRLKVAKKKGGSVAIVFHARRNNPNQHIEFGKYYRVQALEITRDGKLLVPELVRKPGKIKFAAAIPAVKAAIAARLARGA